MYDIVLITHAHVDHVGGLRVFCKKYHPLVYASDKILKEAKLDIENVSNEESVNVDSDIKIKSIRLSHDVADIKGYIIEEDNSSMVYITDTGYINEKSFEVISNKNLYVFESNHDVELLRNSTYPFYLQQRIMGDKGHLSNKDANKYLKKLIGKNTKYIVLAHLSEENNNEKLAYEEEKELLENNQQIEKLYIAKQEQILETIEV